MNGQYKKVNVSLKTNKDLVVTVKTPNSWNAPAEIVVLILNRVRPFSLLWKLLQVRLMLLIDKDTQR